MSTTNSTRSSVIRSAGKVSAATAFSRILGLVREQVMAYFFGAGLVTDAFIAAYRIPNLLRDMFAEGALSSAFVPVFKEQMVRESDEKAFRLASIVITAVLTVVGLIVLMGIIAAPAIVYITANGFVPLPVKFDLTVNLTQIMFAYLLLVSLSAVVMGMLNSFDRFGVPALSPAMFNLGVILSVVGLYNFFDQPAYTLAIGVLVGGVGQIAIQLPSLRRIGYRFRLIFDFLDEGLKRVLRLIGPMIVGLSAGRVNILVSTLLASFMVEGSISYLSYSYRLMHFPLGVFAVALGTVALPKVSELVTRNDSEGLSRIFRETISANMFLIIPSAVFLAMAGRELVALIFQWGAFGAGESSSTALALLHYSYGLIGFAGVRVIVPFFYAFNDSKLPMRISIITVGINLALYYPLIKMLDFAGLAAATSVAGLINFVLLAIFLPSKGIAIPYARILIDVVRMIVAAVLAFYCARLLPISFSIGDSALMQRLQDLLVLLVAGGIMYLLFCLVFRVREVWRVPRLLLRK